MSTTRPARTGFTLIELLVVVAVIVLLISIMLPSLGTARRRARTTVCGTNLRSNAQAMATYAAEWEGAILGNAHTSSRHLYNNNFSGFATGISESSVPEVISVNDWMSPTARVMGIPFNAGPSPADRVERFMQFNAFKGFTCPENEFVATAYTGDGGPSFPVHRLISYNTSLCFQVISNPSIVNNQVTMNFFSLNSYRPNLTKVAKLATKVFMADGGRWFNGSGALALTTNGSITGNGGSSPGGMTSDYGPWNNFTRAYQTTSTGDGRTVSMRHGAQAAGSRITAFKMNAAFFDGHVETLNGLEAANPSLWVPRGANPGAGEFIDDPEIKSRYGPVPVID